MRMIVAGATGSRGPAFPPLLADDAVAGMTRSRLELVRGLGAEPGVCDVGEPDRLRGALVAARPSVIVDLLADLAAWGFEANNWVGRTAHAEKPGGPGMCVNEAARGIVAALASWPPRVGRTPRVDA